MPQIPIGARAQHKTLVTAVIAVDFLGLDGARVLGTPFMIGLMEMTARNLIKAYLDEGFDTVGTEVNVKHLAATPLGMHVRFEAEILEVNDRRVLCKVEAYDEREKIGEGTHERFIIHVARFASRVQLKLPGV
ncbi:MAG TPA: thioesterase family protein [Bryobacteraceae bacterium]|nr:thioesterase family protein [Bryobacteraceae bacterium]